MKSFGFVKAELSGWGRYPVQPCCHYRPEKLSDVAGILGSGQQASYIARGLGRSYGDAAINRDGGVIDFTRLHRFLNFDERTRTLECEAGVSLAEILEYFLPRGCFLPVTPGTKFVTVGGAIAADVHGKNHHQDGTFSSFVEDLTLLTPGGERIVCSPGMRPEVFWATVGGMGLTGVILRARIKLRKVESAYVLVDYQKAKNLDAALDAMDATDERYEYSVAWIDCLAGGKSMGRSVLMRGNHAPLNELPAKLRKAPLAPPKQGGLTVPFDFPSFTLNRLSVAAFNAVYYASHGNARNQLVSTEKFFYPLDSVGHWNRIYGKKGFVQYQVALPPRTGREALVKLLGRLSASQRASFLAVLKRFGEANPGMLSFPMKGYTLALDLPVAQGLGDLLQSLNDLIVQYGGRTYLAKDAITGRDSMAPMYPRMGEFKRVKESLDPRGTLSSSLARRLGFAPS
jgi:decaprenylphospho-beta-D-ribofuranose 2-oxidase